MEYKEENFVHTKISKRMVSQGISMIWSMAVTQEDTQDESTYSFSPGRKFKKQILINVTDRKDDVTKPVSSDSPATKKMKDRIFRRLTDIFFLIKAKIAAGNPHTQVNLM